MIEHGAILVEIGFQKIGMGRSSVLTKYEPVASRVDFVSNTLLTTTSFWLSVFQFKVITNTSSKGLKKIN